MNTRDESQRRRCLKRWRRPRIAGILISGIGLWGCTPEPSSAKRLPDPDRWRVPLPVFDAEQQQRKDEVDQYLALRYQEAGWSIIATIQTYEGDVMDWVDPLTVAGSQEEPPPLPPEEALPEGVEPQLMELEVFPELRGPSDTMPILRPDYAAYILEPRGATSLEDWLNNYQMTGAPMSVYRLYAGFISLVENTGASVSINPFGGAIEANTMSVLELAVGCRANGDTWQLVGIAASRDNINLKDRWERKDPADSVLRLQVEFLTAGSAFTGSSKGGWDSVVQGFKGPTIEPPPGLVNAPGWRPYPPGAAFARSTLSTPGGPQFESHFRIKLFQGNWWVGHGRNWIGYYPQTLFKKHGPNLIADKACEAYYYGEIGALRKSPWPSTDMGSGEYAEKGSPYAAYFRTPSTFGTTPPETSSQIPTDPNITIDAKPFSTPCYRRTPFGPGATPGDMVFFADGPGGDAPDCLYP